MRNSNKNKKINKINSDKVHKCSFDKQSGTQKYIHQESIHHTNRTFKWVGPKPEPPKTSGLRVVMLVSRGDKAANRQTPTGSHDARQKQTGSSDSGTDSSGLVAALTGKYSSRGEVF